VQIAPEFADHAPITRTFSTGTVIMLEVQVTGWSLRI
jgi:hypothetical protein